MRPCAILWHILWTAILGWPAHACLDLVGVAGGGGDGLLDLDLVRVSVNISDPKTFVAGRAAAIVFECGARGELETPIFMRDTLGTCGLGMSLTFLRSDIRISSLLSIDGICWRLQGFSGCVACFVLLETEGAPGTLMVLSRVVAYTPEKLLAAAQVRISPVTRVLCRVRHHFRESVVAKCPWSWDGYEGASRRTRRM